jgi:hypothetical protein
MSKPKEFWLYGEGGYTEHQPHSFPYVYHVIEYSAYKEILDELRKVIIEINNLKQKIKTTATPAGDVTRAKGMVSK